MVDRFPEGLYFVDIGLSLTEIAGSLRPHHMWLREGSRQLK